MGGMMANLFESLVPDITRRALEDVIRACDTRDREEMQRRMDYYRNDLKPSRPDMGMSDDTYRDRCEAWVGVPLAPLLVNTKSGALYGREIARTTGNESYDTALQPIWSASSLVMLQNARLASVVGDTVVRVLPDWQRGLRLTIWSGQDVIPIFDPDDPQEIIGLIYDYCADPVMSQIARAIGRTVGGGNNDAPEARIEIITRHIRDRETGAIIQPGIRARFVNDERVPWNTDTENDRFNPLGDFLDGVFWRNATDPTDARGISDLTHLVPMLRAINEATTDARLLLEWNIYPILWYSGDMEQRPPYTHKAVWQMGERANGDAGTAGMLEWSGNMEGFRVYYDHLIGLLHEAARIPAIATGNLEHVGEIASGRAYEISMRPFIDLVRESERVCEQNERDLIRHCIAALALRGTAPFTGLTSGFGVGFDQPDPVKIADATADIDVSFEPLRLAEDASMVAQTHSTRIGAGFESIETAIRDTHRDWTDDDVRREIERVGGGEAATVDASADIRIAMQRAEIARAAETGGTTA